MNLHVYLNYIFSQFVCAAIIKYLRLGNLQEFISYCFGDVEVQEQGTAASMFGEHLFLKDGAIKVSSRQKSGRAKDT